MHLVTSLNRAGLEKLIYLLCRVNDADSNNQFMVVILNDVGDESLINGIRQTKTRVVELRRKPDNPLNIVDYVFKIRNIVSSYRPDVLHVHNNLSFLAGFLGSLLQSIKIVYTLHCLGVYQSTFFDHFSKWLSLKVTSRFIAVSESVKKDFINCSINPDSVVVVPNCIDIKEFCVSQKKDEAPTIVCVARLDHYIKGQDILIKALPIVKERIQAFKCQLIGEGPSRPFLEQMVKDLGLTEAVSFMGVRNDVAALLSQADLFVLPSRYEGFGIVILEAMASGLPVIISNIDGPAEIVTDGKDGLHFRSGDERDLADKITALLVDKDLRKRMAEASLRRVLGYSIEVMYDRYLSVYRVITDKKS
ncbi:MAG TPA: glycosyltransferase family 4 protein [Dissulfurispiraceae bacterium]|nr:glycosyltransferase family 4 protein [Dissulfurispiraceae bacterium]